MFLNPLVQIALVLGGRRSGIAWGVFTGLYVVSFAIADGMGIVFPDLNPPGGRLIVATVAKWMGLQKDEVVARVRTYEGTSQLELDAPDFDKARELLQLVATYVRDGGRVCL